MILIITAAASLAAESPGDRTVLTVGSETFSESEILRLITSSAGGNEMMVTLMLAQSGLDDRRVIVEQIADVVLFAEAAKDEKFDTKADIAFQIRWQTMQTLLQAYFEQISAKWDYSEAAVRKYYNEHRGDFVRNEAVKASHILTATESDALMAGLEARASDFGAAAQKYSRDPNTAQNGGELGWVEKGMMVAPVEEAIMKGKPGDIIGPVQSEYGWHIIKIEERRAGGQLTFEESREDARQGLEHTYVDQELKRLKEKYPITVNNEALGTIGGIPAPEPAK